MAKRGQAKSPRLSAPTDDMRSEDPISQPSIPSQSNNFENNSTQHQVMGPPPKPRQTPKRATSLRTAPAKRQRVNDNFFNDPDSLLQSQKSPLYQDNVNIKNILQHPQSIEALAESQPEYMTAESDTLSTACAAFKEDGALGRFDPGFLNDAIAASNLRAAGGTAEYEQAQFHNIWGGDKETYSDDDNENAHESPRDSSENNDESNKNSTYDDFTQDRHENDEERNHYSEYDDNVMGPATNHPILGNSPDYTNYGTAEIPILYAPRTQISLWSSDIKLETLFVMSRGMWAQTPILRPGDLIILHGPGGIFKEAKVAAPLGHWENGLPRPKNTSIFDIEVPPGQQPISKPGIQDIRYPRPGNQLHGCTDIRDCMMAEDSHLNIPVGASSFILKRGDEILGSIAEVRQAYSFAIKEYDFLNQINFDDGGRARRVAREQTHEGYYLFGSCLYRKVERGVVGSQNPNLCIDLGDDLNAKLADCAEPGYAILMVDTRILGNDGIPAPLGAKHPDKEEAYQRGPNAFSTLFTRNLAGLFGYSLGHAHIGPLGLTKGYGQRQWNKGIGTPSSFKHERTGALTAEGQARFRLQTAERIAASDGCKILDDPRETEPYYINQFRASDPTLYPRFANGAPDNSAARLSRIDHKPRNSWFDLNRVPPELTPPGALISKAEEQKIRLFQTKFLSGKIVHRPVPRTMAHRFVPYPPKDGSPIQPLQLPADDPRVQAFDASRGYPYRIQKPGQQQPQQAFQGTLASQPSVTRGARTGNRARRNSPTIDNQSTQSTRYGQSSFKGTLDSSLGSSNQTASDNCAAHPHSRQNTSDPYSPPPVSQNTYSSPQSAPQRAAYVDNLKMRHQSLYPEDPSPQSLNIDDPYAGVLKTGRLGFDYSNEGPGFSNQSWYLDDPSSGSFSSDNPHGSRVNSATSGFDLNHGPENSYFYRNSEDPPSVMNQLKAVLRDGSLSTTEILENMLNGDESIEDIRAAFHDLFGNVYDAYISDHVHPKGPKTTPFNEALIDPSPRDQGQHSTLSTASFSAPMSRDPSSTSNVSSFSAATTYDSPALEVPKHNDP